MNFDFRLSRRTAVRVGGVALLVVLGGCVSFHKPRFWDKEDVKTTSNASGSQPNAKPSTDPAASASPAPTVVTADHTTFDDPSGHVSAFDAADPTPSPSSGQNALASGSQPAPQSKSAFSSSGDDLFAPIVPRNVATDDFADTPNVPTAKKADAQTKETDPFAQTAASSPAVPAAPTTPTAVKEATRPVAASLPKAPQSADPFADADGAAFLPAAQPQPAVTPAPQPTSAPAGTSPQPAAPSQAAAAPQPPAVPPPASSPETAWSPESIPVEPPQSSAPPAPERAMPVASVDNSKDVVDAFADPGAPAAPKGPAALVAVDAEVNKPSCAAPASKMAMPCAAAATTQGTSANNPATSEAWVPVRAPASAEQVTPAEALASSSEAPQVVIETVKTPAASKAGPVPSVAKAPVHDAETVARHEPEWPHAAVQSADAPAANSMICDSKSVRGRFTGIGHSTGEAAHPSPPKETPRKPAAQKVPMSRMDADTPRSHAGHDVNAAGQTARAPKPLSGVVNAVAQQIGRAAGCRSVFIGANRRQQRRRSDQYRRGTFAAHD